MADIFLNVQLPHVNVLLFHKKRGGGQNSRFFATKANFLDLMPSNSLQKFKFSDNNQLSSSVKN